MPEDVQAAGDRFTEYAGCVIEAAHRYAFLTKEPADTVVEAAIIACDGQHIAWRAALFKSKQVYSDDFEQRESMRAQFVAFVVSDRADAAQRLLKTQTQGLLR